MLKRLKNIKYMYRLLVRVVGSRIKIFIHKMKSR
jgi:hypothetical protein